MNTIFCSELKKKCEEINAETNHQEKEDAVIQAYDRILCFQHVARREGLLALEEKCETLDLNDDTQALFYTIIMLIVDGTEPKLVSEIGMNRCLAHDLPSYDGLISLMYYRAGTMIQAGDAPWVIETYLKSMLPKSILKRLESKAHEKSLSGTTDQAEDKQNQIRRLCDDHKEIDEKDHSVVNQTAMTLIALNDSAIQRLLRDTDNNDIAIIMKGLPGKARARIFDNLSQRLGGMIAEDVQYMGPVRLRDIEEACVKIMKRLVELADNGEICACDISVIKVVLDLYDNAQKENEELKNKYKELKGIIDEIYRS